MILRYDQAGTGPAIMLLHARPADRTQWRELLPLLAAAGYRAVAADLAGYGESPASAGPQAPWADIRDTLDHLGIDRAVLVGNSLGAQTALQFAATWPDRVAGLCLMGFRYHDQPPSPQLTRAWAREAEALSNHDLDAAVDAGLAAWLSPSAGAPVREALARALRRNLSRRTEPAESAPDPLAADNWWATTTMPARILHGADDMPDFSEGATRLMRVLGAPKVTVVDGAGHLLPLERPAAVATAILDLIAEIHAAQPTTILVTYTGRPDTRFDRDYWTGTHLPLVERAWRPTGLRRVQPLFPESPTGPILAQAVCEFDNEAALTASLTASETSAVMDDIGQFTDHAPSRARITELHGTSWPPTAGR